MNLAGQIQQAVEEAALAATLAASDTLYSELVDRAPVGTGATRDSITIADPVYELGVFRLTASAGTPQALYSDQGTEPHEITPRGSGYPLRFFWESGPAGPGEYRYMRVNHPGQEATYWWSDTVDTWDDLLNELL